MRIIYGLIRDVIYNFYDLDISHSIIMNNSYSLKSMLADGDNVFRFKGAISPKGRFFFLSASSSKVNNYVEGMSPEGGCTFVLDANKIRHNYTIAPINYFAFSGGFLSEADESEVRILSRTPVMPNVFNYIIEIHAYLSDRFLALGNVKILEDIQNECERRGKPIYWYSPLNSRDFLVQNTKVASRDWKKFAIENKHVVRRKNGFKYTSDNNYHMLVAVFDYLKTGSVSQETYEKVEDFYTIRADYCESFIKMLVNSIDNFNRREASEFMNSLSYWMRKLKANNIREFVVKAKNVMDNDEDLFDQIESFYESGSYTN